MRRLSGITCLALVTSIGIVACSGNEKTDQSGSGGEKSTSVTTGGSRSENTESQGGATSDNTDETSEGGAGETGGAKTTKTTSSKSSTGGTKSSSSSGVGGVASGGSSAIGGVTSSGGTKAPSGGSSGVGGVTGAGGKTSSSSGSPTGGSTPSSSSCVDKVPDGTTTCATWKQWGQCGSSYFTSNNYCAATCGTCSGSTGAGGSTAGGGAGSGGTTAGGGSTAATGGATSNNSTLPDVTGNQTAWASRYWDCCKPACGWTANSSRPVKSCDKSNSNPSVNDSARNACEGGGTAYMCWSGVPHAISDKIAYGYAAASGNNYKCGQCFQIQFDGNSHNGSNTGTQAIRGKQMIIQVVNNGGVAGDQFDLLIPGGGVGDFDACTSQWGSSDLGARYGGFLAGCNGDTGCVKNKCNTVFAGKTDLIAGCNWFLDWYKAADNPTFKYQQVNCPNDFASVMGGLQ